MSDNSHRFRVDISRQDGRTVYHVSGIIDEHADLDQLVPTDLGASVEVNLKDVHRFNSYGVRAWINAMRRVHAGVSMSFTHCPPLVIDQLNMVDGLMGVATVGSFYVPRVCAGCGAQEMQFLEVAACHANGGGLIDLPCAACGEAMEIDDIEQRYTFLLSNNPPSEPADSEHSDPLT